MTDYKSKSEMKRIEMQNPGADETKPREFFLGISEGNVPHISDQRKWPSDYHLVEKSYADAIALELKDAKAELAETKELLKAIPHAMSKTAEIVAEEIREFLARHKAKETGE